MASSTTEKTSGQDVNTNIDDHVAQQRNIFQCLFCAPQRIWKPAGLSIEIILIMLKGAFPPVIALAACQSDAWAEEYKSLGYVIAVMALLSIAIWPRARFIKTVSINAFFVCFGAAIALLQIQIAVSARKSTSTSKSTAASNVSDPANPSGVEYNASANAVAALGLFLTVYFISVLRFRYPSLRFACIVYATFTIIASTEAPDIPNMTIGLAFASSLLKTFLTGFGIATGVSLFIYPRTMRKAVFKEFAGLLKIMQACLKEESIYLKTLIESKISPNSDDPSQKRQTLEAKLVPEDSEKAQSLLKRMFVLYQKFTIDEKLARKEVAVGKLAADDLEEMADYMRSLVVYMGGISLILNSIGSICTPSMNINHRETASYESMTIPALFVREICQLNRAMINGLQHISLVLDLNKHKKPTPSDLESKADSIPKPGDPQIARYLQQTIESSRKNRTALITRLTNDMESTQSRQQLRSLLYAIFITESIGEAVLRIVNWVNGKADNDVLNRSRLIVPSWREIKELMALSWGQGDNDDAVEVSATDMRETRVSEYVLLRKLDPDHLQPLTWFERTTDILRIIPHFLSSPESIMGFRVAIATMSIGVLAFLEQTKSFFEEQRVQWSLVMIAISLAADTGSSVYNFLLRLGGTIISVIASLVIWYVCDQNTVAVIVCLYLYIACGFYFVIKFPKYVPSTVISLVSALLILGYELQTRKMGIVASTASGQPYYPIYELAPYRLLIVGGGLTVAFFWTYFPYPVTTHRRLREDLGELLCTLAKFYACTNSMIGLKLNNDASVDVEQKARIVSKNTNRARKLYHQISALLPQLHTRLQFTKVEPTFGGRFPRNIYEKILDSLQKSMNCVALLAHSVHVFENDCTKDRSPLDRDCDMLRASTEKLSCNLTCVLWCLSTSIANAQPLPPHMALPNLDELRQQIDGLSYEILRPECVQNSDYVAITLLEHSSILLSEEVTEMARLIKSLVGGVNLYLETISHVNVEKDEEKSD